MNKKRFLYTSALLIVITMASSSYRGVRHIHPTISAKNVHHPFDSTTFLIDSAAGWSLFSPPYLGMLNADSAELELILSRNNDIDWTAEHKVGIISDSSFFPKSEQTYIFYLLNNNTWSIRITATGECYVTQTSGQPPSDNPAIVPVRAHFKID